MFYDDQTSADNGDACRHRLERSGAFAAVDRIAGALDARARGTLQERRGFVHVLAAWPMRRRPTFAIVCLISSSIIPLAFTRLLDGVAITIRLGGPRWIVR